MFVHRLLDTIPGSLGRKLYPSNDVNLIFKVAGRFGPPDDVFRMLTPLALGSSFVRTSTSMGDPFRVMLHELRDES